MKKISLLNELRKIAYQTQDYKELNYKELKHKFPSYEAFSGKAISLFCDKFGIEVQSYDFDIYSKPEVSIKVEILQISLTLDNHHFHRSIKEQYFDGQLELPESKIYYMSPHLKIPNKKRPYWVDDLNGILFFEFSENCYLFIHDFEFNDYYSNWIKKIKGKIKYQHYDVCRVLGKYPHIHRGSIWRSYKISFISFIKEKTKVLKSNF